MLCSSAHSGIICLTSAHLVRTTLESIVTIRPHRLPASYSDTCNLAVHSRQLCQCFQCHPIRFQDLQEGWQRLAPLSVEGDTPQHLRSMVQVRHACSAAVSQDAMAFSGCRGVGRSTATGRRDQSGGGWHTEQPA
jgi:hypothetical protein